LVQDGKPFIAKNLVMASTNQKLDIVKQQAP
jgi:hypothetical protein